MLEETHVDADDNSKIPGVQGCSLDFDLGQLVIENPFSVVNKHHEKIDLSQLVGLKVISAYSTENEIRITFESDVYISVSMKDEDYTGPEAACYSPKHGNIIVFNLNAYEKTGSSGFRE